MSPQVEARLPGIVVVILGAVFCIGALSYGVTVNGRMGPGLLPMVAGLGLVVFGVLITIASGREAGKRAAQAVDVEEVSARGGFGAAVEAANRAAKEDSEADVDEPQVHHPWRPWIILAVTAGALVLAPYLGLIPSLALGSFVILRFIERESWRMSIFITVAMLGLGYLVFEDLLDVNLPWGVFGGLL